MHTLHEHTECNNPQHKTHTNTLVSSNKKRGFVEGNTSVAYRLLGGWVYTYTRLLTALQVLLLVSMTDTAAGLARSPGREIWLLEIPLRVLRLEAVAEEDAEGAGHPMTISGTELERFISLQAITRRVAFEADVEQTLFFTEESCETHSRGPSFWEGIKENPFTIAYFIGYIMMCTKWSDQLWRKHRMNAGEKRQVGS